DAVRAWKLWLFLLRMLLSRPAGTDRVPKQAGAPARPTTNTTDDLPRRLERATLQQLTDPSRRPAEPYRPLARRGAAPGPSGYTAEILRLVLDEDDASQLLCDVASLLAQAHVPEPAVEGLALGRLVALSKPGGGTRGLVVGDFLRRLVARTIAQQFASNFEAACNPYQYALSTRAGRPELDTPVG
ncbi:unnamed protein product, partial [Symbiodinium natans]